MTFNASCFVVLLGLLFSSCSSLRNKSAFELVSNKKSVFDTEQYTSYSKMDFLDHLTSLEKIFLKTLEVKVLPLDSFQRAYLSKLSQKFVNRNELLLNGVTHFNFYLIESARPFYFSLPNGSIFFSLGLIKKYVRNEGDLASILAYEVIRCSRYVYYPAVIIPKGQISTEKMVSLMRLGIKEKDELNKWIFFVLKRSGFDPYVLLTWIQQQNRNSQDFSMQLGDSKVIVQEEYKLKNFIISQKIKENPQKIGSNSSRDFYKFKNGLKDISI